MELKLMIPNRILVDEPVQKVVAEAEDGSFCLLPNHVDFAAPLVPGLFSYATRADGEQMLAVDEGVLVKCGDEVLVSVRNAVRGKSAGELRRTVEEVFEELDEHERKARSALLRLEASFVTQMAGAQEEM